MQRLLALLRVFCFFKKNLTSDFEIHLGFYSSEQICDLLTNNSSNFYSLIVISAKLGKILSLSNLTYNKAAVIVNRFVLSKFVLSKRAVPS